MSIGEALQRARQAQGLTQAQLGDQAGVSRMTIQRMESDLVDPRMSTVMDAGRCVGLELMLVPASLRAEIEAFIRAGGKLVGREPGIEAPLTAVQDIRSRVAQKLSQTLSQKLAQKLTPSTDHKASGAGPESSTPLEP